VRFEKKSRAGPVVSFREAEAQEEEEEEEETGSTKYG
jgi:hypothetical protein